MVKRRSHPSHGFSTSSRASMARSVWRALEASFSVRLIRKSRWALSLSRGLTASRGPPRRRPLPLPFGPAGRARTGGARRARTPRRRAAGRWPAPPGTRPSRRRTPGRSGSCSSSSRTVSTVCSRKARSWETMTIPPRPATPPRTRSRPSPSKSRSLVGSSRRVTSKRRARSPASATFASCPPDRVDRGRSARPPRAQVVQDGVDPGVEVGGAQGGEPLQGRLVPVLGRPGARRQSGGRLRQLGLGTGRPGPAGQRLSDRLARQVARAPGSGSRRWRWAGRG